MNTVSLSDARRIGEEQQRRVAASAERVLPGFADQAAAAIVDFLLRRGRAVSEDITDAVRRDGIAPPDDRAFGAVFGKLQRNGVIACVGYVPRRKGHGAPGARVWELAGGAE